MKSTRFVSKRGAPAFMLAECLVYLAVSTVLLGLAFAAFYRVMDTEKGLRKNAADITRALQAGERWREDIRQATSPLKVVSAEGTVEQALRIPQQNGEVVYFFTGTNVLRRAGPDAPWTERLPSVKVSKMNRDTRERIMAWRWEVELKAGKKKPLVRPLFTFVAVSPTQAEP